MLSHHVLPIALEKQFQDAGIKNIHNPVFGSWVNASAHGGWIYAYDQRWKVFLENNHSMDEILNFSRQLAEEYYFDVNFGNP